MIRESITVFSIGLFFFVAVLSDYPLNADASHEPVRLLDNLGDHHYAISTSVPRAQQFFDQGLILSFGFNHAEGDSGIP